MTEQKIEKTIEKTEEQTKKEETEEQIRKEQEFKKSVLNVMKSIDEMPAESKLSSSKREMKQATLKLFSVAKVGTFITRTDLGKLIGYEMPIGNWRREYGKTSDSKVLIDFNDVKNQLRDKKLISESTLRFGRGKAEYRFTLLRPVTAEDVE